MNEKAGFFFHVHHDELVEWSDDIEERRDYIMAYKPEEKRELRLALIVRVPETAMPKVYKARAEYDKAREAFYKARAEYDKAWARYDKAMAEYDKARAEYDKARAEYDWQAIHAKYCHPRCPWDGETIFAKGKSVAVLED